MGALAVGSPSDIWAVGSHSPFNGRTLVLRYPAQGSTLTPTPTGGPATSTRSPTVSPPRTATGTPTGTPTATATYYATPCTLTQPLIEGFESGTLGAFHNESFMAPGWSAVTTSSHSGVYSAFAPDIPYLSFQHLVTTNPIALPSNTGRATLTFWHRYAFELPNFDCGALWASTNGGATWSDAGPNMLEGGYNGVCVQDGFTWPGWIGTTNGEFTRVVVNLLPYAGGGAGRNLLFRFTERTDNSVGAEGWWIDDVEVSLQTTCPTGTPTATLTATSTASRTRTRTASATVTASVTNTSGGPSSTPTATSTPCTITFSDVATTDYFYEPVRYLYCAGAISGYADSTFHPYSNTTRGQLSKIVVLAEGWNIDTMGGPHFSDVPTNNPFYAWIETAYNRGIISGYNDGTFRWGNDVTRGQLCKIVVLAEEWEVDASGGPHFSDVPITNPFYEFIETAYNRGIISGYADGTFRPGNPATRGQIAKIVYNAIAGP
jgi:hypothetical protein